MAAVLSWAPFLPTCGSAAAAAAEPRCGCALTYAALYLRQADDDDDDREERVGEGGGGCLSVAAVSSVECLVVSHVAVNARNKRLFFWKSKRWNGALIHITCTGKCVYSLCIYEEAAHAGGLIWLAAGFFQRKHDLRFNSGFGSFFFFFPPLYCLEKWRRQYFSGQQSKHFFPSFFIFSFLKINLLDVTEAFFPQRWNGRCQRLKAKNPFPSRLGLFSGSCSLFIFFCMEEKKISSSGLRTSAGLCFKFCFDEASV